MKRIVLIMPILAGLIVVLVSRSCTKEEVAEPFNETLNTVIFEDLTVKENFSQNPFENHIYRIEILGMNLEQEVIVDQVMSISDDIGDLNIHGIRKYYLSNSEVVMYAIPKLYSDNSLIVYRYEDLYQFAKAEYTPGEDGVSNFRLLTPDGSLYYGMSYTEDYKVGNFVTAENHSMHAFSNKIHDRMQMKVTMEEGMQKAIEEPCCRQMEDWEGCFECTVDYFSSKWYGLFAFATIGKEFMAAIGISCIGAGPDARC